MRRARAVPAEPSTEVIHALGKLMPDHGMLGPADWTEPAETDAKVQVLRGREGIRRVEPAEGVERRGADRRVGGDDRLWTVAVARGIEDCLFRGGAQLKGVEPDASLRVSWCKDKYRTVVPDGPGDESVRKYRGFVSIGSLQDRLDRFVRPIVG